jgi:hypothetical protein
MRNAIVLGSGRSGTSLLAGLFHASSYFSGANLWGPTESNPLGYFEDVEINNINEDLLDKVAPWRPRSIVGAVWPVHRDRTRYTQRWLTTLPAGIAIPSDAALDARMAAQTTCQPYLFKDPRFSYTLANWAPHLAADTLYVCVFREPQRTVNSILTIVRQERYLRDLRMTMAGAYRYWEAVYRSVLHHKTAVGGDWIFLHYDEIMNGDSISLLEDRLGASADRQMVRPDLKRSALAGAADGSVAALYRELCDLAERKSSRS